MREVKSRWSLVLRSLGRKARLWVKVFEPIVADGVVIGFLVSMGAAALFHGGVIPLQDIPPYTELPIFLAVVTAGIAFLGYVGIFALAYLANAVVGQILRSVWRWAAGDFERSRIYAACKEAFKEANAFLASVSTTICLVVLFFFLLMWEKIATSPHATAYALAFWLGGNLVIHAIFWTMIFFGIFFMEITKRG